MAAHRAGYDSRPDLLPDVAHNQGDILLYHPGWANAAMEQFMEYSPSNDCVIGEPIVDKMDSHSLVGDTGENLVVLKCFCGKYVPLPVNDGDRLFRNKWLQKIFNLICQRAY